MKVKVDTKLEYESSSKSFSGHGIFKDNVLKFKDDNTIVVLDFLNKKMIREDDEKKIEYSFLENTETLNSVLLKCNNYLVSIPIYTDKFSFDVNSCLIRYKLVLEDMVITYLVEWR